MSPFKSNKNAATAAFLALLALIPGYALPFMSITKLGTPETFSLPSSIIALLNKGELLIGVVLFTFSIVFPLAKLFLILMATSSLPAFSPKARKRLRSLVTATGKYSMLDLFVVALMIVVLKIEGMVEARVLSGTAFFCAGVLLSMVAGHAIHIEEEKQEKPKVNKKESSVVKMPEKTKPANAFMGGRGLVLWVIGAILAVGGLIPLLTPLDQMVDQVEISKGKDLVPAIGEIFDTPDYYVRIKKKDGEIIKTESFEDKLIGNGIRFKIDPMPLRDMEEISVVDENIFSDSDMDRVYVRGMKNHGQQYNVILSGPTPLSSIIGVFAAGVGFALLIGLSLKAVRRQAL